LDAIGTGSGATSSETAKFLALVQVTAKLFSRFLAIHPYANGNGHAARFLAIAILHRYGYWPAKFPVEPRPSGSEYSEAIKQSQWGNPAPLESLFLTWIKG
jgi:Fic family protein